MFHFKTSVHAMNFFWKNPGETARFLFSCYKAFENTLRFQWRFNKYFVIQTFYFLWHKILLQWTTKLTSKDGLRRGPLALCLSVLLWVFTVILKSSPIMQHNIRCKTSITEVDHRFVEHCLLFLTVVNNGWILKLGKQAVIFPLSSLPASKKLYLRDFLDKRCCLSI